MELLRGSPARPQTINIGHQECNILIEVLMADHLMTPAMPTIIAIGLIVHRNTHPLLFDQGHSITIHAGVSQLVLMGTETAAAPLVHPMAGLELRTEVVEW